MPQTSSPKAAAAAAAPKQQQAQGALLRSNVAAAAAAADGAVSHNTNNSITYVPSMQPWSSSNSSSNCGAILPLPSQRSTVQQQLMYSGFDAFDSLPVTSTSCLLASDSLDSMCLAGTGNSSSSSGWSSSSSSIGCNSPTASIPTNLPNSCLLLGDSLSGAAAAAVLPCAAVYPSTSNGSSVASGSADLALALQQLKLVPEVPAGMGSSSAAPNAATAGMMFEFPSNNGYNASFPSVGLAGDLQLLQPSVAANALLLQQQREQLLQQQLLLAQQEQMLLQQQMQIMSLGLGGQQMMLFSN
jgi:hypothetical protein